MSFPHSKPYCYGESYRSHSDWCPPLDGSPAFIDSTDRSIDASLKSVPLPTGFMSRLKLFVGTLSDEASGNVDYLGC